MKNKKSSLLLIFISVFMLATVAASAQITKIGTGHDPAIYDNMVTWSDDAGSIHLYDLTTQKDTTISSSGSSSPAIYSNKLVWHDESSGTPRLTVYDISSGVRSYITQNVDGYSIPKIYGSRIVWNANQNESNYNYNVYLFDISTSTQTQIAVGDNPDIYDTKVVYSALGREINDIFMYDITTKKIELISPESSDLNIPQIYGNIVIWSNIRTRGGFIQMYDFVTKKAIDVTSDNTGNTIIPEGFSYADAGDDTGSHFAIYGNKIVYVKGGNDQFGNEGVYVYNILTGQSTPVLTYPEYGSGTPDIYDNTFVWGRETNDNEIYICNLTTIATTQLPRANFTSNVTSGYAPLSVQFTDQSKNATSQNWDFGDGNNSTQQNPIHTYSEEGTYAVKLLANNENYTDSKLATITVLEYKVSLAADFSTSVTSGYAPLFVQFTDNSQNAASRSWDFGDGSTSIDVSPGYTYNTPGTYTATLTVSNGSLIASKPVTITVLQVTSSDNGGSNGGSSHSSGSSGGGGGGSPEPAKNVEVKELSQTYISSGKSVKFDFPGNATSVVYVSFDSKKTTGKTNTIVEMLKGKSTLVSDLPSGEVYKSLNIWVGDSGFGTSKNIENSVVCFKVEKSWIKDKNIDMSSITLNRYSDKKWNQQPTNLSGEDKKFLYFTAKTTGFSSFVILGKTTATNVKTQPVTGNEIQNKPKTGNVTANTEQTPEQAQSSNMSGKENTKAPGFEIASSIICLLCVFLYTRRKKENL